MLGLTYIETIMKEGCASGSGFMISDTGLCFTCNHVIEGAQEIYVRLENREGERSVYKAEVVCADKDEDYAVIQLENCQGNFFFLLETDYSKIKTGDDVAVYGFPFGSALNGDTMELEPSLTKGYISSKNKIAGRACYYLDIRSAPGNSGGPVFALNTNKVIGYLCGSYGSDRSNLIYIRTLQAFFKDHVKD